MIRPWYAFYPGDYANDTAHLSLTEHGAYRLLLDRYYMTGKPLQANAEQLLFVCRAFAKADADAVLRVLSEFFEIRRDGYHHKRADKELRKMGELSEKRREAGKIGAAVRQANAEQLPSNCLPQSQSHTTDTKKEERSVATQLAPKAPPGTPLDLKRELWARAIPFLQNGGLTERTARSLVGKWRKDHGDIEIMTALASAEAAAASEPAAYVQAVLNAKEKPNGRAGTSGQHGQSVAGEVFGELYARGRAEREGSGF